MNIGETILDQLGGNGFVAMTGARLIVSLDRGLQFRLPARFAKDGITYVRVILDPSDTYTVTFGKINRKSELVTITETFFVYADQLRTLFRDTTGLEVAMPRISQRVA